MKKILALPVAFATAVLLALMPMTTASAQGHAHGLKRQAAQACERVLATDGMHRDLSYHNASVVRLNRHTWHETANFTYSDGFGSIDCVVKRKHGSWQILEYRASGG